MISLKNNNFLQACIPLALVLTFFCTPVFSLDSVNDFESFNAYFSAGEYSGYPVENCFGVSSSTGACIGANYGDYLVIDFPNPVNLTSFDFVPSVAFASFSIDGVMYPASQVGDLFLTTLETVSTMIFYALTTDYIWVNSVAFDFEYADVGNGNGVSDNDITEGINWSLFAYSFTVVTFFAMLGRGVKSIIDLIKYG